MTEINDWHSDILRQMKEQNLAIHPCRQLYADYADLMNELNIAKDKIKKLKNRPSKEELILSTSELENANKIIEMQQITISDLNQLVEKYLRRLDDFSRIILYLRKRLCYEKS